jgi:hypothetical protein
VLANDGFVPLATGSLESCHTSAEWVNGCLSVSDILSACQRIPSYSSDLQNSAESGERRRSLAAAAQ